jgi:hypothetical protein
MKEHGRMPTPRRRRKDQETLAHIFGTPATVPRATGDSPNAVENLVIEPTHEDVARRAYHLYEQGGAEHGRDRADWFQAEDDLRQRAVADAINQIVRTRGSHAAV